MSTTDDGYGDSWGRKQWVPWQAELTFIHFSDIRNNYSRYLKTILDIKIHVRISDIWIIVDIRINYFRYLKICPVGTDGRLPLSDLDLDLGSGHTAYRRASLIDLYLRTKFHWDRKKKNFESHHWDFGQVQSHVTQKLGQISKIRPDQI